MGAALTMSGDAVALIQERLGRIAGAYGAMFVRGVGAVMVRAHHRSSDADTLGSSA